jgi:hypothetical protein
MRPASGYRYELHICGQILGPYPRATIVGMRVKGLLGQDAQLVRSDKHPMTVAELVQDRFEMADAATAAPKIALPSSGIWPTFLANFGGGHFKLGALGFVGEGEVRLQGDYLRFSGRKRTGLIGSSVERLKIMISDIGAARRGQQDPRVLELVPPRGKAFPHAKPGEVIKIILGDKESTSEALELMNLPTELRGGVYG